MSARSCSAVARLCLCLGVAVLSLVAASPSGPSVGAAPCWFPPVEGTVTDPFRAPPCPWCAGNRGLDYRIGQQHRVRAAASGRVEFVGTVVDVRYVVIRLSNGWRHTYGQLTSTSRRLGEVVLAGAVVGRASGTFFFGLRIGDDYANPAPFIGELRGRPRLVPLDGTAERPGPAPRPTCSTATARRLSDERTGRIRSVRSSPRGSIRWQ